VAKWDDPPRGPFCSPRCRLLDLGRWAGEEYRVPAEPDQSAPAEPGAELPPDRVAH